MIWKISLQFELPIHAARSISFLPGAGRLIVSIRNRCFKLFDRRCLILACPMFVISRFAQHCKMPLTNHIFRGTICVFTAARVASARSQSTNCVRKGYLLSWQTVCLINRSVNAARRCQLCMLYFARVLRHRTDVDGCGVGGWFVLMRAAIVYERSLLSS